MGSYVEGKKRREKKEGRGREGEREREKERGRKREGERERGKSLWGYKSNRVVAVFFPYIIC